jgi:PhnB protein
MQVQTYLTFNGRCQEALDFYRDALGAEVTEVIRIRDVPEPPHGADANNIVYASLQIGETTVLAMDGPSKGAAAFAGFHLSLVTQGDEETERLFGRLADGGSIHVPLTPTFFSSRWGIVADRFGVNWMVLTASVAATAQAS